MRIRFRWLALGLFMVPVISGLLLGEFFFLPRARDTLVDQFRTELEREMGLGADLLARSPGASPDSLAGEFTRSIGFRVSIISLDGRVIGDSDVSSEDLPGLDNHADRPEVAAALTDPGNTHFDMRRSATLGVGLLYGARQVEFGAAPVVLRIAIPLRAVDDMVGRLSRWLRASSVSLLFLSVLLGLVFSASFVFAVVASVVITCHQRLLARHCFSGILRRHSTGIFS